MEQSPIDTREAKHLLSIATDEIYSETGELAEARQQAANRLLEAFTSLAPGEPGALVQTSVPAETTRGKLPRLIFKSKVQVCLDYQPAANKFVFYKLEEGAKLVELGHLELPFSPLSGEFVTHFPDVFIAPSPGEPLPRRAPLALLVGTAIGIARSEIAKFEERFFRR